MSDTILADPLMPWIIQKQDPEVLANRSAAIPLPPEVPSPLFTYGIMGRTRGASRGISFTLFPWSRGNEEL